jgi:hypothetical protein
MTRANNTAPTSHSFKVPSSNMSAQPAKLTGGAAKPTKTVPAKTLRAKTSREIAKPSFLVSVVAKPSREIAKPSFLVSVNAKPSPPTAVDYPEDYRKSKVFDGDMEDGFGTYAIWRVGIKPRTD